MTAGVLLKEEPYSHKYPYDWRTKKPTIFRATSQWFASVEGFRGEALGAIAGVSWVPAVGQNRITAMTEGRSDWCISRQRKWGVPIPVFYDLETGVCVGGGGVRVEGAMQEPGACMAGVTPACTHPPCIAAA